MSTSTNGKAASVAYLIANAGLGGAELLLALHLRQARDGPFKSLVICGAEGPLTARLRAEGVAVHIAPLGDAHKLPMLGNLPAPRMLANLAALLRGANVQLIHSWTMETRNAGHLLALATGRPLIQSCQDLYFCAECGALQWWLLAHVPARIIATSLAVRRCLRVGSKLPARSVRLIRPGIDLTEHQEANAPARRAARQALGIAADAPVIGIVGRFSSVKGHDLFLHALARLLPVQPTLRALVVGAQVLGSDDRQQSIETLVRTLGLDGRVVLTGFREPVAEVMAAMDVVVCASSQESFGLSLVEAAANARPVVSTRCGGPEEIVIDGITGLLVPVGSVQALADALGTLLAHPERARLMGRLARRHALRNFGIETMVQGIEHQYREVLARHTRRHPAPLRQSRAKCASK